MKTNYHNPYNDDSCDEKHEGPFLFMGVSKDGLESSYKCMACKMILCSVDIGMNEDNEDEEDLTDEKIKRK